MTKPLPLALCCLIALTFSSATAVKAAKKISKPVPDVKKALATELPKAVIGGTFSGALEQFGTLIDIPVVADWSGLASAGVKRTTKVSVRVPKKITAEKLLE
ncbi:MAG: hypothetical protein H8E53_10810, partial [Planctomycetes bacterium]|nr:hypothetical protein [Planctomycetota bacterium]